MPDSPWSKEPEHKSDSTESEPWWNNGDKIAGALTTALLILLLLAVVYVLILVGIWLGRKVL